MLEKRIWLLKASLTMSLIILLLIPTMAYANENHEVTAASDYSLISCQVENLMETQEDRITVDSDTGLKRYEFSSQENYLLEIYGVKSGSIDFDRNSKTLTMKNVTMRGPQCGISLGYISYNSLVPATLPELDLTIRLVGNNKVIGLSETGAGMDFCHAAIYNVKLIGNGSLTMSGSEYDGVRISHGNITIDGPTITVETPAVGALIFNYSSNKIPEKRRKKLGQFTINSGKYIVKSPSNQGFEAYSGKIAVCGGKISVSKSKGAGIDVQGDYSAIKVSGGKLTVSNDKYGGIICYGTITVTGGILTTNKSLKGNGITCSSSDERSSAILKVSGGKVNASGNHKSGIACDQIIISKGNVITGKNKNCGITNGGNYLSDTSQYTRDDGTIVVGGKVAHSSCKISVKGGTLKSRANKRIGLDCKTLRISKGIIKVTNNRNIGIKCSKSLIKTGGSLIVKNNTKNDIVTVKKRIS